MKLRKFASLSLSNRISMVDDFVVPYVFLVIFSSLIKLDNLELAIKNLKMKE